MLLERGIQVFDVGAVVHIVMQRHGLLVNEGFECVVGIGERGYFMCHDFPPGRYMCVEMTKEGVSMQGLKRIVWKQPHRPVGPERDGASPTSSQATEFVR